MVARKLFKSYSINSFFLVFTMVLMSFLVIGGCNDNNGGTPPAAGGTPPAADTSCATVVPACHTLTNNPNGTFSCILSNDACAVDLGVVIDEFAGTDSITADTVMWIEAWGGNGGRAWAPGGAGGYAVTTTTVNDIASINSNSNVIYYFLGGNGGGGSGHCGAAGATSTIVTTEDLVMNPSTDPTSSSPPVLLVAGGGAGSCGINDSGFCGGDKCVANDGTSPAGGVAIATMDNMGSGAGESNILDRGSVNAQTFTVGGNQNGMGSGGVDACIECGSGNQTSGLSGFGGRGGAGGDGSGCSAPGSPGFINVPTQLTFTSGQGGKASSNTNSCDMGGGGGGGGYGGGGGGGHGNSNGESIAGAGGGSLSIQSTQSSDLSPTSAQDNPCGEGCVRITFAP